ncbi:hypothetical protein QTO30_13665 [Yoonia sp. GPGPB17]|uniref:hypothetical protein n=1 Tax=Yoonia sp. GPGPB17 TaxID=3026147 RepID=UPI0030C4C506
MKCNVTLWTGPTPFYAAFIAWHRPLRGSLSEADVRAVFGNFFDTVDRDEGAGSQAFLDFFLSDDGAPFYMVNRDAEQGRTPEMETAAREYGALMMLGLVSRPAIRC